MKEDLDKLEDYLKPRMEPFEKLIKQNIAS